MANNNFELFGFDRLKIVADNLLNILFNDSKEIPIADILKKICVTPPYFAFKKIYKYKNILISQIKTEQIIGNEISLMSVGESGRHMAILGSCSCSIDQKDKFYYLVKEAKIELVTRNIESICNNENLYIAIESQYIDNRLANACGIMFNDKKEIIYRINVRYNKVKTLVFAKFFHEQRNTYLIRLKSNPYKKMIAFENKEISHNRIIMKLPSEVTEKDCAGHFDGYYFFTSCFF